MKLWTSFFVVSLFLSVWQVVFFFHLYWIGGLWTILLIFYCQNYCEKIHSQENCTAVKVDFRWMCACNTGAEETFRYSTALHINIYSFNVFSYVFVARPLSPVLFCLWQWIESFLCTLHKLMYELPGNTHSNIPATVHKSTSEHLAAGLAGRWAGAAKFPHHAVIQAAVCSVEWWEPAQAKHASPFTVRSRLTRWKWNQWRAAAV